MPKGICCAAQAAGDLGRPLIVNVVHKNGTTTQRCGVCEVRPSCSNPQKLVFAFRFLKSIACGLAGATKCTPSSAGIAQYNAERTAAAAAPQTVFSDVIPIVSTGRAGGSPYTLPPS
jgi:hypothetical protein